ncbi:porin family protein [Rufibacter roseus]|uniref:Porin family protein n=1 Tax=Rufibacter roseus TaxID=1567108 RepID=A0ABW2DIX3_9BACT|nr:porin family protein [Rufibacter roseus]
MKKLIIAGAIMLLSSAGAFAQTSYGLKGGLNISSVRIPDSNVKSLLGFHVGGFTTTQISDRFALQPELLYSQQGYKDAKYDYRFHYLNVPLIFKGTIAGGLHAQVGPQFGILLNATRKEGKVSEDITKKKFDSAVGLGFGYDMSVLQFSARYNLGLTDTNDNGLGFNGFTNNVFQLSVGVSL